MDERTKRKVTVGAIVLIAVLTVLSILNSSQLQRYLTSQPLEKTRTKNETQPSYDYVTEKPVGWFETGQEADIVLYATGFNDSSGARFLNHPGKVATDGQKLIVSDTWNNRVLIWDEIPTKNNEKPDIVLGQPDFNHISSENSPLFSAGMNRNTNLFLQG